MTKHQILQQITQLKTRCTTQTWKHIIPQHRYTMCSPVLARGIFSKGRWQIQTLHRFPSWIYKSRMSCQHDSTLHSWLKLYQAAKTLSYQSRRAAKNFALKAELLEAFRISVFHKFQKQRLDIAMQNWGQDSWVDQNSKRFKRQDTDGNLIAQHTSQEMPGLTTYYKR